jgi:polysaccharide deacetylase family protein (PEP-CTERM system associated)
MSSVVVNALSFDIEDWFHLVGIASLADARAWDAMPSLVVERTDQILGILDDRRVRATFFILGWVADRHPDLVRRIGDRGHEIASHGYWHQPVYAQSPEAFREDVTRSLEAIGAAWDGPVAGYRAPTFSITPEAEWAFDVLADLGFRYDASRFPGRRAHGGAVCPDDPHRVRGPGGGELAELPMSVERLPGASVCYSGGGYLRLLPLPLIRMGFRRAHRRGRPVVVYLHPRDLAPDCPRAPMPPIRRFKSYVGLASTERKLRALLDEHRFDTCLAVLESAGVLASPEEVAA